MGNLSQPAAVVFGLWVSNMAGVVRLQERVLLALQSKSKDMRPFSV